MKIQLVLLSMLLLFACVSSKKLQPTPEDVTAMQVLAPSVTLEELQRGYKLYVQKCTSCHRLRNPVAYSAAEWQSWLIKMFKKAKISNVEEQRLISQFIESKRINSGK